MQSPSPARQRDRHPPSIIPLLARLQLLARLLRPSPSLMEQGLLLSIEVLLLAKQRDVSHSSPTPRLLSPCIGCSRLVAEAKVDHTDQGFLITVVSPQTIFAGSGEDVQRDSPCLKHCNIQPAKAGRSGREEGALPILKSSGR